MNGEPDRILNAATLNLMSFSTADYLAQAILAFFVFIYPWFIRAGREWQAVVFPFVLISVWGLWRMFSYDIATHNDIPGMGYIVCAFFYTGVSLVLYGLRHLVLGLRARRRTPGKA